MGKGWGRGVHSDVTPKSYNEFRQNFINQTLIYHWYCPRGADYGLVWYNS